MRTAARTAATGTSTPRRMTRLWSLEWSARVLGVDELLDVPRHLGGDSDLVLKLMPSRALGSVGLTNGQIAGMEEVREACFSGV